MSTSYFIKLNQFEGPLDLLLHLIQVHELDILDIDLEKLTEQYLKYLRLIKFKDLKEAASFLQMAASLLEMKSRALLPSEENSQLAEEGEESEQDSIEGLQERLLEYKKFQEAAEQLRRRGELGAQFAYSPEHLRLQEAYAHIEGPLIGDKTSLIILYEQNLSLLADRREVTVKSVKESFTVEEAIEELRKHLSKASYLILQESFNKIKSRYELVAHILAALQVVRDGECGIHQQQDKGPLWVYDLSSENLMQAKFKQELKLSALEQSSKEGE